MKMQLNRMGGISTTLFLQQWSHDADQGTTEERVLVRVQMNPIDDTGLSHAGDIEKGGSFQGGNALVFYRKACTLGWRPEKFRSDRPLGFPDWRRGCHEDSRRRHPRFERSTSDGVQDRPQTLSRLPGVVRMHGLEVICPQHDDDKAQGGIHFDPLFNAYQSIASGLERILPNCPPSIEAIFDDANLCPSVGQGALHHAGPTRVEREPFPGIGNNTPAQGIAEDQDLMHATFPPFVPLR